MFLVRPAAVAGEVGGRGALPGVARFFDGEDAAAAAESPTALDHRDEGVRLRLVEAGNAEEADVFQVFEGGALGAALAVVLEAGLDRGNLIGGDQAVSHRDGELLLPAMALLIGGDEGVCQLVFVRSGRFEATGADLRDIGAGTVSEGKGVVRRLAGGLIEGGVDFVGLRGRRSAAGLVERGGSVNEVGRSDMDGPVRDEPEPEQRDGDDYEDEPNSGTWGQTHARHLWGLYAFGGIICGGCPPNSAEAVVEDDTQSTLRFARELLWKVCGET